MPYNYGDEDPPAAGPREDWRRRFAEAARQCARREIRKDPDCPECGAAGPHETAVRSGEGLVDIGWRCRACGHEFGFEMRHEREM